MRDNHEVQKMIDTFNIYLKNNHIHNEYDDVALVLGLALQEAGQYRGYHHAVEVTYVDADGVSSSYMRSVSPADAEFETSCVQFL